MSQFARASVVLRAVALTALTIGAAGIALGDDTPPPANPTPGARHNNPAWAACKKQADDQKLQAGDARREFMKTCLKSARSSGVTFDRGAAKSAGMTLLA
jgi:psiF repeat-containing protein